MIRNEIAVQLGRWIVGNGFSSRMGACHTTFQCYPYEWLWGLPRLYVVFLCARISGYTLF